MDKMDLQEKIWGGIFGIVAIVAAVVEMFVNGISAATVVGAVKDIFGTLIVIVLFVAVIKLLSVKKPKNFREALEAAMEKVKVNYQPFIRKAVKKENASEAKSKKLDEVIRYEIAAKIDVLLGKSCNDYLRFFDINAAQPSSITFFVREKFFGNSAENPYDAERISTEISASLAGRFPEYKVTASADGITVDFGAVLSTYADAERLAALIDTTILLFIAENRKV